MLRTDLITVGDITKSIKEWSRETGIPAARIIAALNAGRAPADILFKPHRVAHRRNTTLLSDL